MNHIKISHDVLDKISHIKLEKVLIESPLASPTIEGLVRNKKYARECMRDCLKRGEAPYASHLLYAQEGLLDDNIPEERALGIHAGLVWGREATKTIVYTDLGISSGMERGIFRAKEEGREVEYRELGFIPTVSPLEIQLEELRIKVNEEINNQKLNSTIKIPENGRYTKEELEKFLNENFIKTEEVYQEFNGKHKFKYKAVFNAGKHEIVLWKNKEKFYLIAGEKGNLVKTFFDNQGSIEIYNEDLINDIFLFSKLNEELEINAVKKKSNKI